MPSGLKVVTVYFLVFGLLGLVWPLLDIGPHHPEFEAKSFAFRAGSYVRQSIQELGFLACGVGLLLGRVWARKAAVVMLVIATIYGGNQFAWGLANGQPTNSTLAISYAAVVAWNAIWIYLLLKPSSAQTLK